METVVRAFELPLNHADKAVWPLIRECWQQATMLANWCARQLAIRDVVRTPGMVRLPKMPEIDLYALAFGRKKEKAGRKDKAKVLPIVEAQYPDGDFFAGAKTSAVAIMKAVREKYVQERLQVVWFRGRRTPEFRYPQAWPVAGAGWHEASLESGKPVVRVALPGGRTELQLRGGAEFGRQMGLFRQVVEGSLPRIQLAIRGQAVVGNCGRKTIEHGAAQSRVMIKMVAELPVKQAQGDKTLTLAVDPQAFWVAEVDGRRAWTLNNDHIKRAMDWIGVHEARRQRLAQDAKAERRMGEKKKAWLRSLERACDKQRRRMASWLHESAAHLTSFAVRNRVGLVVYDDSRTDYMPGFPWADLRSKLADKLQAAGIVLAGGEIGETTTNEAS